VSDSAASVRPKRRYPRAAVHATAQLQVGRRRIAGELGELSRGGGFVAGIPPIEPGTEVRGWILLPPENVPIAIRMRALYNRPDGTGVAFTRGSADAFEKISRAVDRSNLLLLQLLFSLTAVQKDAHALTRLARGAGLPGDLAPDELAELVKRSLERFKL